MNLDIPIPCRLFLFDLDGTLIDSRADIARSVNLSLVRLRLPQLPTARIIEFVGDGVEKLMGRALREACGKEPDAAALRRGLKVLLEEYGNHLMDDTVVYPGVREALEQLGWAGLGVVSNKPERFARQVLEGFGLARYFFAVLGGDSLARPKPDPALLFRAMEACGVGPEETVMVGDSATDIAAGRAAGTITCGFSGGFRTAQELLDAGCDLLISSLLELPRCFCPPPQARRT